MGEEKGEEYFRSSYHLEKLHTQACFKYSKNRKYTAKVGQDNVNIGVVTIFQLVNTSLLQVY